jgi:uncharacterized protein
MQQAPSSFLVRLLVLSTVFALCGLIGPAAKAQSFQRVPPPPVVQANPNLNHIWLPAPAVKGGVSWEVLMKTKEVEKQIDGVWYITPDFPPEVRKLDGKRIKVNGYMLPLQKTRTQTLFVLMAYSPSCPYCLTSGSQALMEVRAVEPIPLSQEAMVLTGDFELLSVNPEGLFYRLRNAKLVPAEQVERLPQKNTPPTKTPAKQSTTPRTAQNK